MARGRRPLPTAVKSLRGNPGKRPLNANEPEAVAGDPVMPAGLSEAAQQEFQRMLAHLRGMAVSTPVDATALAVYAVTYDIWMQAVQDINKNGIQIEDPIMGRQGSLEQNDVIAYKKKKNPAVQIAFEAKKTIKSYLSEFGGTPASRGKLHVDKPEEKDASDKFFDKKAAQTRQSIN